MVPRCAPVLAAVITTALVPCAGRPNFLYFQPDDLDWMEQWSEAPQRPPNSDSTPDCPTDNLDKLRTEGVVFTRAYSSSPMCTPSRFSVLTGRYASRSEFGRVKTIECDDDGAISSIPYVEVPSSLLSGDFDDANNLATALKLVDPSYRTGTFGKWHVSGETVKDYGLPENYAAMQDFALSKGFDVAGGFYFAGVASVAGVSFAELYGYGHNLEWMVAEAMDFLEASVEADQPFFAYVNPTVPHSQEGGVLVNMMRAFPSWLTPAGVLEVLPDKGSMSVRGEIDELIETHGVGALGTLWVDDAFGALYDNLLQIGVLNDTVVVFAMDHGSLAKGSLFEHGTRIAMFARYPPLFPMGLEVSALVSNIDILPTFVDIAAAADPPTPVPEFTVDGQSFKALASGEGGGEDRTLFLEHTKHRAAVTSTHKLIRRSNEPCGCPAIGTAEDCEHTSPDYPNDYPNAMDADQLYDLRKMYSQSSEATDSEQENLVEKPRVASVVATLNAALDTHMASTQIGGSTSPPTAPPTSSPTATPATPAPTTAPYKTAGNGKCAGNGIATYSSVDSVEVCAGHCQAKPATCSYFSFSASAQECWIGQKCTKRTNKDADWKTYTPSSRRLQGLPQSRGQAPSDPSPVVAPIAALPPAQEVVM